MKFKDIEEAVLAALNITSKLKDPELTTAIQSILDKCVAYREEQNLEAPGVLDTDDPAGEVILGELTPDNIEDLYTEKDMQKHFGEGQAEGLDNLLEGLKDTPHDNRW